MKISDREKVLLIVLAILISALAYHELLLTPQIEKIGKLKEKANVLKEEVDRVKIATLPNHIIHREYKVLNTKILHSSSLLFPEIVQEKLILIIDQFIKDSNITFFSLGFGEEEITTIDVPNIDNAEEALPVNKLIEDYYQSPKSTEADNKEELKEEESNKNNKEESNPGVNAKLKKMYTTLNFKGSYNNLISIIKAIENYDKRIVINSLNVSNSDGAELNVKLDLDFYALPKLYNQNDNYLEWNIFGKYGKDNPFSVFSGYSNQNSIEEVQSVGRREYDFIMTVKPVTSDLPTVIVGKSKDNSMESYVYAENPDFENVEFRVMREGSKYYYKYKTEDESYPKDYNDKIEFNPKGNSIDFSIISHSRNNKNDNNGVNLSLINDTDLSLNVHVDYDDENRSRVNIINRVGNISIK